MASKEWMLSYVHALANAGALLVVTVYLIESDPFVVRNLVQLTPPNYSLIIDIWI